VARKSTGDKKLEALIDGIHKRIEQYEVVNKAKLAEIEVDKSMVGILRQQLNEIEETCKEFDNGNDKEQEEEV
jgi:Asp-tRNA(Asn)/Glu-tRNA(Gln) amidotransferase C subunit